ncbi:MAG: tryptophan--tRNA ligase [Candidatus Magasanikbacteria bacterium]|nr:tryptophan--tRNA ligase [Candidatus Magasanikbacteria bacterium]
MTKPIIVSGMQPTGNLHIGNYLGALKNWVDLQNSGQYQLYLFVADLHSLTLTMTPETRRENVRLLAAEYIAAGIDPAKTTVFVQSHVPEHSELAWIFNCVTPVSELERMTQFKDKAAREDKNINAGLLTYPILQAADILLYHGTLVPVGQDQVQHLELTRDIARWFNNKFGDYFPTIKPLLTKIPKVMSLLEPAKKMSKSKGAGHIIALADEPEIIINKLKKAVTASAGGGQAPGVENLLSLLQQFGATETHQKFIKAEQAGTIRYGDLKQELAAAIAHYFADFRQKRQDLLANPKKLEKILMAGAQQAGVVARATMSEVKKIVGIR